MKVVEMMMGTPYYCRLNSNLGEATELMWRGNCGFLPVVGGEGNVVGVLTDRDVCIALGTRGRPAGEVAVADVMSKKVFSCAPDDDVHTALGAMREGRVRRLRPDCGGMRGVTDIIGLGDEHRGSRAAL